MKICVIDDDINASYKAREMIKRTLTVSQIDIFTEFDEELPEYDIFFLDIYLGDQNGIDISYFLLCKYPLAKIVFISANNEEIFNVMPSNVHHFIRKDNMVRDFVTLKIMQKFHETNQFISLKERTCTNCVIQLNRVRYVESRDHYVTIYMYDKTSKECYSSLKAIEATFSSEIFMRIHRSYVVNLFYIQSFNYTSCTLKDKTVLPVSRKYVDKLYAYFNADYK